MSIMYIGKVRAGSGIMLDVNGNNESGGQMSNFKSLNPLELEIKALSVLRNEWGLLTAGSLEDFNMMTIGWGYFGTMWNKPVFGAVVRPNRHTYGYLEKNDLFTVSFFKEEYRDKLQFCGTKSGRDVNKAFETGLKPATKEGAVFFEQADTILVCKKISFLDFKPENFLDPAIIDNYPEKQFHRLYIGEVLKILKK
jgi:flavin reductase (DIM6/NTAB) family NADH-FMN oxidoreductase RutF